jgi:hypothetical protein
MQGYEVKKIESKLTYPFLLDIHYAKRIPSISYAFGLFYEDELVGVCTFGTPSSSTLREGLAGKENKQNVLELNRLCLTNNLKNEASFLVAKSLKKLPYWKFVVSFADTSQKHLGIVYQACNFLYTGLSAKRTDWVIEGFEHLHGQTIGDKYRGVPNRSKVIKEIYGDKFKLVPRPRKHRYVYITGKGIKKREMTKNLKYKVIPYPKNEEI